MIGFGAASFITNTDEKQKALSILFKHQTGKDVGFTVEQADSVCVFKIESNDFKGKKKPRQIQ